MGDNSALECCFFMLVWDVSRPADPSSLFWTGELLRKLVWFSSSEPCLCVWEKAVLLSSYKHVLFSHFKGFLLENHDPHSNQLLLALRCFSQPSNTFTSNSHSCDEQIIYRQKSFWNQSLIQTCLSSVKHTRRDSEKRPSVFCSYDESQRVQSFSFPKILQNTFIRLSNC